MANYPDDVTCWPMRSLVLDDAGQPIRDAEGWRKHAEGIRRRFVGSLGERPASQKLHSHTIGDSVVDRGVKRTLVTITVDEDDLMEAWLLEPASKDVAPRGVALAPHQTTAHGKDEVAGVAGRASRAYGLELAQRGWTVLAPDGHAINRRYARELKTYDTKYFYDRFPNWSSVGKIIADLQACLDLLEILPQTAGRPVSAIGHSLGAQSAAYLAACDPRPVSVVSNCGLYPFADARARAHWFRDQWYIYYTDKALKKSVLEGPQPLWDFHEILALTAPRRLLYLGAPNDPICGNVTGIMTLTEQLHRLWNMLGATNNLSCILHNEDHAFEKWHRQYAYAWMENERANEN